MKVYSQNVGKILAKININEHINFINNIYYVGKNNKIQRIFQQQFLKNRLSDYAETWELSFICRSFWYRPILIADKATSFCLWYHLKLVHIFCNVGTCRRSKIEYWLNQRRSDINFWRNLLHMWPRLCQSFIHRSSPLRVE